MTRTRIIACCLAVAVAFCLSMTDLADAKRLGGGRSFGGSPSYQRSFTPTQPSPSSPAGPNMNRQQQTQQPGPAAPQQAPRSRFGGFGGIMGGMLAGSLLGSLLFGGGFGGVGMVDMLLIALVAFMALKFFAARRGGGAPAPATGPAPDRGMRRDADHGAQSGSGAGWDALRSAPAASAAAQPASPGIPEGFDTEDFLRGAKLAYTRLQSSWDRRDLDDIAQFTTPDILKEITRQAQEDPGPSRTEILYCNASVLSVAEEKGRTVATVFFDVLMREDAQADAPGQVREVWHFVRSDSEMWRLDGIQQVEM
ncbi:Tim44 domain-containing protein [Nitratidesulfovibrio sp. 1201_IL3209]|uniref:Tim44 domain-containing protein n=1 Tax=Nitratidesulfovibrio sp. 1201_IL3209 TaxID=3084053 RepID=UPI002FD9BCB2